MITRPSPVLILLLLTVAAVAAAVYLKLSRQDTETGVTPSESPAARPDALPRQEDRPLPAAEPSAQPIPLRDENFTRPVIEREELFEVTEGDMTPFLRSEIAAKWKRELGYTDSEFVQVQRDLRAQGYDETRVNDPGIIRRHLPPRHISRLRISGIDVPETVPAGEPVPFTLRGTKPHPTWSFVRYDVNVQGGIIRLNAVGHAEGDVKAGLGGEVELTGEFELDSPPGRYRLVVPELGPEGQYTFEVIEPTE